MYIVLWLSSRQTMKIFIQSFILLIIILMFAGYGSAVDENYEPHKGTDTECKGTRMEFNDQMKEVKCMPRKSLVPLRPEVGYSFFPNMVSVRRCGGYCTDNLSCMPLQSVIKPIPVRRYYIQSKFYTCYRVYVEEHTKCKCGCNVMAEDCNEKQIYMEEDCTCQCTNIEEEQECRSKSNMMWDAEKCKCTCIKPKEACSSRLIWVPDLCMCANVMMPDDYS